MMKKNVIREKPFEFLRDKNGNKFSKDIVNNWYIARLYVLDKLKDVAFKPNENSHLQVIIDGDSPLMLSVVRFIALYAHYINFKEDYEFGSLVCKNRTVITLVSRNEHIIEELGKEEYLSYMMDYYKSDSYLDTELHIVEEPTKDTNAIIIRISEKDINEFVSDKDEQEIFSIDTRKAVIVGSIYNLGSLIDNLPAEDIHCAKRYTAALDAFSYNLQREETGYLINQEKWERDLIAVKNGISSIFCSDCFESRALSMNRIKENEYQIWEDNNEALSVSEHARWVTERLIMGYRPFNDCERFRYQSLLGDQRNRYIKKLKTNPYDLVHIDICSFRDLRRINPDDLKYDSFMMLAIPIILEKQKS